MVIKDLSNMFSSGTAATYNTLGQTEKAKPDAYQSRYQGSMDDLMNQIVNRGSFNYDLANDKLYAQYKDSYAKLGAQAMGDTVSEMGGLTGGYGNTYAAAAGAIGNQEYLREMNDVIPELYEAALNKHAMETADLHNRFAAVGQADDRAYGQYRDTVSDWQADRDYYLGKFGTQLSADRWKENLNQDEEQFQRNLQYQRDYDAWEERKRQEAAAVAAAASAPQGGTTGTGKGRSGKSSKGSGTNTETPEKVVEAAKGGYLPTGKQTLTNFKNADSVSDFLAGQVQMGVLTPDQALGLMNYQAPTQEEENRKRRISGNTR